MVMARWSVAGHTQAQCMWLCVLYCYLGSLGHLCAEGAQLRCGSELLGDLIFVCGDRGIYLGKQGWSGYGPRPRGKGIVDQCCLGSGCDLNHLEKYCAKARAPSASQSPKLNEQFEALFQRKLVEKLGAPESPMREAYRRSSQLSARHKPLLQHLHRRPQGARQFTIQPPVPSWGLAGSRPVTEGPVVWS